MEQDEIDSDVESVAAADVIAEHEALLDEKEAEEAIKENEVKLAKRKEVKEEKIAAEEKLEKVKETIAKVKKEAKQDEKHEDALKNIKEVMKKGVEADLEAKKDEIEIHTEEILKTKAGYKDDEEEKVAKPMKMYTQEDLDRTVHMASTHAAQTAIDQYKMRMKVHEEEAEKLADDFKNAKKPEEEKEFKTPQE
jgi:hypothetical protein